MTKSIDICYRRKVKTINKGTTIETSNLQPGELIHVKFAFYNFTSIYGFTSMLTGICANTIIVLVFPTASKISTFRIDCFIPTTLNNNNTHANF